MNESMFVAGPRQAGRVIAMAIGCWSICVMALLMYAAPAVGLTTSGSAGDPIRGKEKFDKRCGGCHSLDTDKEGPHLRGVYGRKAGSVPGFRYSDGMKAAHFSWDGAALDRWLTNTESLVPDNDMDFHVPKGEERADIIEFLRVSSQH